jgi:glycosyltransferase involved in cell wall biosynthesis
MGKSIGILSFPVSKSGANPLSNFVDVISSVAAMFKDDPRIRTYNVQHVYVRHNVRRIVQYFNTQAKMSSLLVKLYNKVDIWIFFIGGEGLFLPMVTAKLLRKKVLITLTGFQMVSDQYKKDELAAASSLLSKVNLLLADRIIVYSQSIVKERGLEKYSHKVSIAHRHIVDSTAFRIEKRLEERSEVVGYIGRLADEKGIMNFIEAIPYVRMHRPDAMFLIGGDGPLEEEVRDAIRHHGISDCTILTGWIHHDDLPPYLNALKVLVVPSYTEGLPNIILEAMACGTPVLATPVGAIPDIIRNGETGFLLDSNSPQNLADGIMSVLAYPDIQRIVENGEKLVADEFNFKRVIERYEQLFGDV